MYFIEILSKILHNKNLLKLKWFNNQDKTEFSEDEKCNHTFVPIDSTGNVFACINCGFVINKTDNNIERKQ